MERVHDVISQTQITIAGYRSDLAWVGRYDTLDENKATLLKRLDELERQYDELAFENDALESPIARRVGEMLLHTLHRSITNYALELQQLINQRGS